MIKHIRLTRPTLEESQNLLEVVKIRYKYRTAISLQTAPLNQDEFCIWKDPEGTGIYALYLGEDSSEELLLDEDIDVTSSIFI